MHISAHTSLKREQDRIPPKRCVQRSCERCSPYLRSPFLSDFMFINNMKKEKKKGTATQLNTPSNACLSSFPSNVRGGWGEGGRGGSKKNPHQKMRATCPTCTEDCTSCARFWLKSVRGNTTVLSFSSAPFDCGKGV